MNHPKTKLLLFDLDGTLVRTGGAGIRALQRAMSILYQIQNPLEGVTVAGNTDPSIFREIISYHQPQKTCTQKEEEIFFDHYLTYLEEEISLSLGYKILPGILEILRKTRLSPNIFVGLGTGNVESGARIKLERGGLNPYFTVGGFGSDSSNRNELLKIAVQKAQVKFSVSFEAQSIFIIGDTPRDIQAGRAIGAKVVAVATGGYTLEDLQAHTPDYLLQDLSPSDIFFEYINKD